MSLSYMSHGTLPGLLLGVLVTASRDAYIAGPDMDP